MGLKKVVLSVQAIQMVKSNATRKRSPRCIEKPLFFTEITFVFLSILYFVTRKLFVVRMIFFAGKELLASGKTKN